jgi:hypothetical protein
MPGSGKVSQGLLIVLLAVLWSENSWAVGAAMKKPCADCHIMHDSQAGAAVALGFVAAGALGLVGPQEGLTKATCSGCHEGVNIGGGTDAPFVVTLSGLADYRATGTEVNHNTLAGGNFWWVTQVGGDLKGHNVVGVGAAQVSRVPPGGGTTFTELTCAGTNGCHGDNSAGMSQMNSIWGGHHGNTTGEAVATPGALLTPTSYRFLNGIKGFEDPTWEYTVDKANHNQYKGVVRSSDGAADASSVSFLCARCHGDFHNGAGNLGVVAGATFLSPWLRHPVDIDMGGLGGEFLQYGDVVGGVVGAGVAGDYNVSTPLASTAVTAALSAVTLGSEGNNAIITCLSCHRAHGSPWDYSLRWDYQNWPGAGYNGCGDCHTVKN